ncbi:hypothetical protein [Streptomyces sp. NPDC002671]
MLPTEPPLSLHRLVAPVPPARTQETATAVRQTPAPAPAKPSTVIERLLVMGHNQVGNAVVAGAAARTSPDTLPRTALPTLPLPSKPKAVQAPASP